MPLRPTESRAGGWHGPAVKVVAVRSSRGGVKAKVDVVWSGLCRADCKSPSRKRGNESNRDSGLA